jgi:hypothetical protein
MKRDPVFWIIIILILTCFYGIAEGQEKVISAEGITDAEIDTQGNIYLSTEKGAILKYNPSYQFITAYASNEVVPVSSLDVSFHFRIFGFYQSQQSYILLDRNFKLLNEVRLEPELIGNAVVASYSSDNLVWLFDEMDFSLLKFNPTLNQLVIDIKLPLLIETERFFVIQLEEYQNRIYLNNAGDGIYVFDLLGNFLKKLEISTDHIFKIGSDCIFFIDGSLLKSFQVYTNEERIIRKIENKNYLLTVLATSRHLLLIYPDKVIKIDYPENIE